MKQFQRIQTLPAEALAPLVAASTAEGFRFLEAGGRRRALRRFTLLMARSRSPATARR
jgi:hypothetical protein